MRLGAACVAPDVDALSLAARWCNSFLLVDGTVTVLCEAFVSAALSFAGVNIAPPHAHSYGLPPPCLCATCCLCTLPAGRYHPCASCPLWTYSCCHPRAPRTRTCCRSHGARRASCPRRPAPAFFSVHVLSILCPSCIVRVLFHDRACPHFCFIFYTIYFQLHIVVPEAHNPTILSSRYPFFFIIHLFESMFRACYTLFEARTFTHSRHRSDHASRRSNGCQRDNIGSLLELDVSPQSS
ncbi:hypothetical protein DFH06DRAFT_494522 [Mycena polygramma]|nr:hypothetical protein DFH06DRAFT_494522 [Mycena polygramma]